MREFTGVKEITLEVPAETNIAGLKRILAKRYPAAAPALGNMLVAINKDYALDDDIIPADAELAFFPQVSGGGDMPTLKFVTSEQINFEEIISQITLPSTGAVCLFTGLVRAETYRGGYIETQFLEYDAYIPMAEEKMDMICQEIRQKWPSVEGIAVVQRIGNLYPGMPTVIIACSAAHRDTGVFEAARYGIDRLKQIVPVWKREVTEDEKSWVEGDYDPTSES